MSSSNIYPIQPKVSRSDREKLMNQRGKVIWFTGLSGSGKSTLAIQLEAVLHSKGFKTYLLDGDNMRLGLNQDLTFSAADRTENIRRIGEVSKLLLDAGVIVLSAFISPFESDRDKVRQLVGEENYLEVFVDAPLEVCESRDVKGIYSKARRGLISNFTGIDSPYERPSHPFMTINTDRLSIEESVGVLIGSLTSILQTVHR
jgi:adenylylsulfate kinase